MHRHLRDPQSPHMFRGAELMRLMTGILMLGVLYMIIVRARDPDTWRWLANDDNRAAPTAQQSLPQTPKPVPAMPPATGDTDEDSDQQEEARNEFQAITDGSFTLGPEEMEAYDRLVFWAENQPFDRMARRARKDLLFTHFYDEPDKYRGQLVVFDMTVCRIIDAGKNRYGVPLHEVWGFTPQSGNRLYAAIVVDLPKGMPIGYDMREKVRFAGYFLKLQGYQAAAAKPGQAPEKAPLLIGRLKWEPIAAPRAGNSTQEWLWAIPLLAIIGLGVGLRWLYCRSKRRKPAARLLIRESTSGEVVPIDAWLERANFSDDDETNGVGEQPDSLDTDQKRRANQKRRISTFT